MLGRTGLRRLLVLLGYTTACCLGGCRRTCSPCCERPKTVLADPCVGNSELPSLHADGGLQASARSSPPDLPGGCWREGAWVSAMVDGESAVRMRAVEIAKACVLHDDWATDVLLAALDDSDEEVASQSAGALVIRGQVAVGMLAEYAASLSERDWQILEGLRDSWAFAVVPNILSAWGRLPAASRLAFLASVPVVWPGSPTHNFLADLLDGAELSADERRTAEAAACWVSLRRGVDRREGGWSRAHGGAAWRGEHGVVRLLRGGRPIGQWYALRLLGIPVGQTTEIRSELSARLADEDPLVVDAAARALILMNAFGPSVITGARGAFGRSLFVGGGRLLDLLVRAGDGAWIEEQLKTMDDGDAAATAAALCRRGRVSRSSVAILQKRVGSDMEEREALEVLAGLAVAGAGASDAAPSLGRLMASSPSPSVRLGAALALCEVGDPGGSAEKWISAGKGPATDTAQLLDFPVMRCRASVIERLRTLLSDDLYEVGAARYVAWGGRDFASLVGTLRQRIEHGLTRELDTERRVEKIRALVGALAAIGEGARAAEDSILSVQHAREPVLRYLAANALRRIR